MKKLLPVFISLFAGFYSGTFKAQNFIWVKGSNTAAPQGLYGNLGAPTATTTPGGRAGAVSWKDASGNAWIFSGEGYDFNNNFGFLNDLWKYNATTNQWTWMKGDNVIAQIGVYGTLGTGAGTNKPGGRMNACSWIDLSGKLWVFGGYGYAAGPSVGYLNDLWMFDPNTNQWTWMAGSNSVNSTANYGTIGIPASSNIPGPRSGSSAWADGNGNLWMHGGYGTATTTAFGYLNDLWRYNIAAGQWTWINGGNSINISGIYGTLNVPAASNSPGGRHSAATWMDLSGNMWLMGGNGYDIGVPSNLILNDLWKYDLTSNQWTWKGGSNGGYQNGVYGTQGVAASANIPGARQSAITWTDAVGNLWLLGGQGLASTNTLTAQLNDFWKYNISSNQWMWVKGAAVPDQNGTYGTQGTGNSGNRPGARNRGNGWTDANNVIWLFGGEGFAAAGGKDRMNDVWKIANCYIAPITLTITSQDSVICAGETTSLTVNGGAVYLWAHNSSTLSSVIITPSNTTTYSVSTTDGIGCIYTNTFSEIVSACDGIAKNTLAAQISVFPNPNSGDFSVVSEASSDPMRLRVFNGIGQEVLDLNVRSGEKIHTNLSPGLYVYEFSQGGINTKSGKLIIK